MTKKRVLMLGAGFMQGVAIRAARALGCTVVAADGNPSAACAAEADEFVHIDLKDTARLIDYARYLQQHGGLDAVFTAATDFSAAVAAIAAACGLRGHLPEAALNATDKVRMRECFRKAGVPSPAFVEFTAAGLSCLGSSAEAPGCTASAAGSPAAAAIPQCGTGISADARNATNAAHLAAVLEQRLGALYGRFPLVVKPVDNMGARGCSLARDAAGLQAAVADALRYSRSGRVIVEEYIEGSEFSIEGLIFGGQLYVTALADRHIFFPPYFIEMGHTIPSDCPQALADEVITVFERGVHSLGLTDGAVKGDILVRAGKAFVGEIAARLSGGYMSGWTVPYSSGLDITAAALTLALGGSPRLHTCGKDFFAVPLKQNCPFVSAERAWISIPGRVAAVYGLDAARAVPFVKDVFPRAGVGDTVTFPRNNVEKCGNVLSAAPGRAEAVQASESACRKIVLRLQAHVAETDAFLAELHSPAEQYTFPPNILHCEDWGLCKAGKDGVSFKQLLNSAAYTEKDGFVLPDFLAAVLDSARDVQGRTLRDVLQQALELEPGLTIVLCASASAGTDGSGSAAGQKSDPALRRSAYWKALIRGGLQGLLYRYDCEHV
ncbi:MAG: ATP-grasp domain-containing protein [Treponema sp.]|uniref:ATP-grasp domain-containing protein n=1 Tax=Treponema sp. TaxID=166 RepID=UPI003FA26576